MTVSSARECRAVLAAGSLSFNWASRFLSPDRRDDAAVVYTLCRTIDDIADDTHEPAAADAELSKLAAELAGERAPRDLVGLFFDVAERRGLGVEPVLHLIEGARSDLRPVVVADDVELLRYCYRVAGTVGLLMCGVLGVRAREAEPFAVDLGIAMQLTNIVRDVAEDARRGRVYLPATRLAAEDVQPEAVLEGRADRARVARVVAAMVREADGYYRSADLGMRFIPLRPRLAIYVASRVYREIGHRLVRRWGGDAFRGRTVVSAPRKAWVTLRALARAAWTAVTGTGPVRHHPDLHRGLDGLPGSNAPRALSARVAS
mgnify:CR=1 FL=1